MSEQKLGTRLRYTDNELSLIKNTFSGNRELLVMFRKFLLDGDMTENEQSLLSGLISNDNVINVLEKAINPKLDKLAAEFQTVDLFSSIDIAPVPLDHALLIIKARNFASQYLDERFKILRGDKTKTMVFDEFTTPLEDKELTFVRFLARNFMLSHIDVQLFNSLLIIAGKKEETLEQQKKRLTMDSSK